MFDCCAADRKVKEFRLTLGAIQVLRTILFCFRNKKTGMAFPTREAIAQAAGLSLRTVGYALKDLRKAGWLKWWRRRKSYKRYGVRHWVQTSSLYEIKIPGRWKRCVAECKNRPGTTSVITKTATGQLLRRDKGVATVVKPVVEAPKGYGDNVLKKSGDEALDATIARGYRLACEREERKREAELMKGKKEV
jgi:alkylated DNA nucleotide flippase Atl1